MYLDKFSFFLNTLKLLVFAFLQFFSYIEKLK